MSFAAEKLRANRDLARATNSNIKPANIETQVASIEKREMVLARRYEATQHMEMGVSEGQGIQGHEKAEVPGEVTAADMVNEVLKAIEKMPPVQSIGSK